MRLVCDRDTVLYGKRMDRVQREDSHATPSAPASAATSLSGHFGFPV